MVKAELQRKATANKPALHSPCPPRKGGTGRRDRAGARAPIEGMSFCSPGQFACSNINCYWKCLIWLKGESQRGGARLSRSAAEEKGVAGAFAPNLVMLKGNWYWVNNTHNTHQFSALSMFTHFHMLFSTDRWHNSRCTWKIYRKSLCMLIWINTHTITQMHKHSSLHTFNKLFTSAELH